VKFLARPVKLLVGLVCSLIISAFIVGGSAIPPDDLLTLLTAYLPGQPTPPDLNCEQNNSQMYWSEYTFYCYQTLSPDSLIWSLSVTGRYEKIERLSLLIKPGLEVGLAYLWWGMPSIIRQHNRYFAATWAERGITLVAYPLWPTHQLPRAWGNLLALPSRNHPLRWRVSYITFYQPKGATSLVPASPHGALSNVS